MIHSIEGSWRHWLRPLVVLILLGSYLAASLEVAFGFTVSVLLLTALLLPLLWPRPFGSWRSLILLLLVNVVPPLVVAAIWPAVAAAFPAALNFVLALSMTAWIMLPATLALLLWRRLASIPIMLLGLAAAPAASLIVLLLSVTDTTAASSDPPATLRLLALMTPMWLITLACCLGPLFFLGTLGWLLYLEATRGEKRGPAVTPAPPARAEDARRSVDIPGPGES